MLFSTGGAAIKSASLTGWQVASFRSAVAAAAVLCFVPRARRNWTREILLVGVAYAATLVLFVQANKLTTAASAIFLQSTAPFYLLLLGPRLLKEPIRRTDILLLALAGAGMSLMFLGRQAPLRTASDPLAGNVLGVCSGITWALTLAGLRWLDRRRGASGQGMATVAAGNLLAFLLCLPKSVPATFTLPDVLVIIYLGAIQIGLAYVLLTRGLRTVPALESSLLLLVEPVLSPVWAAVVHNERPSGLAVLGGVLILGASFGRTFLRRGS